ncbi:MAG TPA: hypothetical protein DCZ94_11750 [Lentisphaeria bacterium]|nr:MAG: hypothetical protein A2X48_09650 [Lentisphaerae bacterium GWF2_49_21]HBC87621.1 hypothetical protein [Lentisphaeria bacterium]
MKGKTIVTAVLVAFVAVSVFVLIKNEISGSKASKIESSQDSKSGQTAIPAAERTGVQSSTSSTQTAVKTASKTIVYYFHGNMRCATCMKFEAYSKDVINSRFKDDISSGKLEFKVVNVDENSNTHFVRDYNLTTRSLVVSRQEDGKEKNWSNLDQIWDRVGDEAGFKKYVEEKIKDSMSAK